MKHNRSIAWGDIFIHVIFHTLTVFSGYYNRSQVKQFSQFFFQRAVLCVFQCVTQANIVFLDVDLITEPKNIA